METRDILKINAILDGDVKKVMDTDVMPVPKQTFYCVKNCFNNEEFFAFDNVYDLLECYKSIKKDTCLYDLYMLNYYDELLERENVIEKYFGKGNHYLATITDSLEYEIYDPDESVKKGEPVWRKEDFFRLVDEEADFLRDNNTISKVRKRNK